MAQHDINLSIEHPIPVGNVATVFEVRQGRALRGRVRISRGGVEWTPANKQSGVKITWNQFAEWMES